MSKPSDIGGEHECTIACLRRHENSYWCARYSWGGERQGVIEHKAWRTDDLEYKLTKEEWDAMEAAWRERRAKRGMRDG